MTRCDCLAVCLCDLYASNDKYERSSSVTDPAKLTGLKTKRLPASSADLNIRSAEFLQLSAYVHFDHRNALEFLPDIFFVQGEAHKQRPPTLESSSSRLFHRGSCGAEVRRLWVTKELWYWLAVEGNGCLANAIGPGLAPCSAVFGFLVGSRRSSTKHSCSSAHHHSQTLILCLFFFFFSFSSVFFLSLLLTYQHTHTPC